jgi:hypothetical protein
VACSSVTSPSGSATSSLARLAEVRSVAREL